MRELTVHYYDVEKSGSFRAMFCGMSKAGKTHLLGTFPNPFIIDTDNGGRTLKEKHIPFISYSLAALRETDARLRPQPYEEIRFILGRLILNKGMIWIGSGGELAFEKKDGYAEYPVQTLGFDSATMLSELLLAEAGFDSRIGETKNVAGKRDLAVDGTSFAEYRAVKFRMMEIFDMVKDLRMNIIATAGIDGSLNAQGEWTLSQFPAIQGAFRALSGHYFDTVALLEKDPMKPDVHYMKTNTNKFSVGTRDKLPPVIENPTYEKIISEMKKLEGKK